MKELVSVIVPILNPEINPTEEKLLHHCLVTLQNYPIIFITFEGADLSIVREHNPEIDVIYFPDKYFTSRKDLGRLFLMEDFYDRFNWSEFLLIHELNSWVVRDELHYWCKQGYDYLRAAPSDEQSINGNNVFSKVSGLSDDQKQLFGTRYTNNGLYLCRIERMTNTLKSRKQKAYDYRHNSTIPYPDAVFWETEANRFWPHLRKPTHIVRNHFAQNADEIDPKKSLPFALTGISSSNIRELSFFKTTPEAN